MSPARKDVQDINDVHNLYHQKKCSEEDDMVARLLKPYSSFLVKYPFIVLLLVNLVVILAAVLAVVDSTGAKPLPDFSKPTKGFEPRGTTISKKQVTFNNLQKAVKTNELQHLTSSSAAIRSRRSLSFAKYHLMYYPLSGSYDSCFLVYEHEKKENLFNHINTICQLHQQKLMDFPGYNTTFEWTGVHHIPNYIAFIQGRSSCLHVNQSDVDVFIDLLQSCVQYYTRGDLKQCSDAGQFCYLTYPDSSEKNTCLKENEFKCEAIKNQKCRNHPKMSTIFEMSTFLYNIFHYLTPSDFEADVTSLTITSSVDSLVLYGLGEQENFFKPIYDATFQDLKNTLTNSVEVVAYSFYDLKFYLFQNEIVLQSMYIITAILLVIIFIWFYSASLFVGIMTVVCIIYALIIAYFVYGRIFDVEFFPFLNMATLIFIVGIGADDAFVYSGAWEEAKKIYVIKTPAEHIEFMIKWTTHSLRHALLAMLVTSLTTASAFYANMSSPVTSVKCFGLFAGTSIIVNYLLMVTLFPVVIIIHDRYLASCMNCICPTLCTKRPYIDEHNVTRDSFQINTGNNDEHTTKHDHTDTNNNNMVTKIQSIIDIFSKKLFYEYFPTLIINFRYVFVLILLAFGIAGCVVTFGKPGLKLPTTSEFQMFSGSSSLELYGLKYKQKFPAGSGSGFNLQASIIFGLKDIDNGNALDPDDNGYLEYRDKPIDLFSNQLWLSNFCDNLEKASFYTESLVCKQLKQFFLTLTQPCNASLPVCCGKTFPLTNSLEFNTCLNGALKKSSNFGTYGALYDQNENMKVFSIDVTTKFQWSLDYTYNDKIYNEASDWFKPQLGNASDSMIGWWFFEQQFYDLQSSLSIGTKQSLGIAIAVSFVVILITTWDILLSLYSILTITFIISVTVGILILSGWQLNIMESVVFSVAAGLSADFTLHYSVAYRTSHLKENRFERVKSALTHIGPAILMGAFTTFIAGLVMLPSTILAYIQMAQFLMLVMFVSWLYSTFFFLPLCAIMGPVGSCYKLNCATVCPRKSSQTNQHVSLEAVKSTSSSNPGGVYYGQNEQE